MGSRHMDDIHATCRASAPAETFVFDAIVRLLFYPKHGDLAGDFGRDEVFTGPVALWISTGLPACLRVRIGIAQELSLEGEVLRLEGGQSPKFAHDHPPPPSVVAFQESASDATV